MKMNVNLAGKSFCRALCVGLTAAASLGAGSHSAVLAKGPQVSIEIIDSTKAWASPCWGYNAPKIVRNAQGEMWVVSWGGKYGGHERARILKRTTDGRWLRGAEFDSLYQPSMIFLDNEGRLNYIQNAQTLPIRHYRSADSENLKNFSLVSTGNGIPDGRGWYVGVAVHGKTMYLAYVTLQYDLFYTWKGIRDSAWHPAVLVEPGVVDTAVGNHSWLYPRFNFFGGRGYITASSTVDGSKQNTYNKVCMVTFPVDTPEKFEKETVYDGAVGYYSYSYDTIITPDSMIVCGFNAGRYKYGEKRTDILPAGLYVATRKTTAKQWSIHRVDEGDGGLAFHWQPKDGIYALVTRGGWDKDNSTLVKRSTDYGSSWSTVTEDVMTSHPEMKHQYFAQSLRPTSGSVLADSTIYVLLTNHTAVAPVDGLYDFTLLLMSINLR
jgi:hypothetical protein